MSKTPMQAMGDPDQAGKPDGVNDQADDATGGESQGGDYPNPHSGKKPKGFEGGQSVREYHGSHEATDVDEP